MTADEAAKYTLLSGDVLMTEGGDLDKPGRGTVWEGQIPGCLHQNHVFAVRTEKLKLDPQFLSLMLESAHGRNYFRFLSQKCNCS